MRSHAKHACLLDGCDMLVVAICLVLASFLMFVGCKPRPTASDPSKAPADVTAETQSGLMESSGAVTMVELAHREGTSRLSDQLAAKQDAVADDWDSEVVGGLLDDQLQEIAHLITSATVDDESIEIENVVDDQFHGRGLRPQELREVYRHNGMTVIRGDKYRDAEFVGPAGFRSALSELVQELGTERLRAKFKVVRIERTGDKVHSRVFFEASGAVDAIATWQQTATWDTDWSVKTDSEGNLRARLISVAVADFEQNTYENADGSSKHLFADITEAVLSRNASYEQQVLPGIPFWMDRMSREFMSQFGHHGLAIGDVNGDGLEDIYVCDTGGLPNRLYVQQPDGTALDVSEDSGVNLLEDSVGCLLVDLDNDGDQDLVVATDPLLQFAENDGSGRFMIKRGFYANTDSYSLSAADYDDDGDLDIFVCGYNARKQDSVNRGLPFPVPYHDANNGGENHLLRNDGSFVFRDVTRDTGLDQHNTRFSLAASWEDYDDDGDVDLYVANDFGRNCLYRNDGGHFVDVAAVAGVEDHASGMSVTWSDFNRDGRMDLYVSNMFSAAGNRVTFQRRFADGLSDATVFQMQRMARGNTLFSADDNGTFRDVSETFGVTMGRWAWSSRFADLNNDGWQDLMVANGYVTNHQTSDL